MAKQADELIQPLTTAERGHMQNLIELVLQNPQALSNLGIDKAARVYGQEELSVGKRVVDAAQSARKLVGGLAGLLFGRAKPAEANEVPVGLVQRARKAVSGAAGSLSNAYAFYKDLANDKFLIRLLNDQAFLEVLQQNKEGYVALFEVLREPMQAVMQNIALPRMPYLASYAGLDPKQFANDIGRDLSDNLLTGLGRLSPQDLKTLGGVYASFLTSPSIYAKPFFNKLTDSLANKPNIRNLVVGLVKGYAAEVASSIDKHPEQWVPLDKLAAAVGGQAKAEMVLQECRRILETTNGDAKGLKWMQDYLTSKIVVPEVQAADLLKDVLKIRAVESMLGMPADRAQKLVGNVVTNPSFQNILRNNLPALIDSMLADKPEQLNALVAIYLAPETDKRSLNAGDTKNDKLEQTKLSRAIVPLLQLCGGSTHRELTAMLDNLGEVFATLQKSAQGDVKAAANEALANLSGGAVSLTNVQALLEGTKIITTLALPHEGENYAPAVQEHLTKLLHIMTVPDSKDGINSNNRGAETAKELMRLLQVPSVHANLNQFMHANPGRIGKFVEALWNQDDTLRRVAGGSNHNIKALRLKGDKIEKLLLIGHKNPAIFKQAENLLTATTTWETMKAATSLGVSVLGNREAVGLAFGVAWDVTKTLILDFLPNFIRKAVLDKPVHKILDTATLRAEELKGAGVPSFSLNAHCDKAGGEAKNKWLQDVMSSKSFAGLYLDVQLEHMQLDGFNFAGCKFGTHASFAHSMLKNCDFSACRWQNSAAVTEAFAGSIMDPASLKSLVGALEKANGKQFGIKDLENILSNITVYDHGKYYSGKEIVQEAERILSSHFNPEALRHGNMFTRRELLAEVEVLVTTPKELHLLQGKTNLQDMQFDHGLTVGKQRGGSGISAA